MSDTFKDVSTVKPFKNTLIEGRGKPKQAGYKETGKNGVVRATYEGRHETFLNDASVAPKFDKSKNAHNYKK